MPDPVDALTGMLMAAQLEIERLRAELQARETVTATLTDDCGLGAAGDTAVVMTAAKWDEIEADNARLRAELQAWQQRFGDCEATVLRMEAARGQVEVDRIAFEEICFNLRNCSQQKEAHVADSLKIARNVLAMYRDRVEVPRRAGTGEDCDCEFALPDFEETPAASLEPTAP